MVNVAMLGASGRMGRAIIPLLHEAADLRLSGALAAPGDTAIGQDAGVLSGIAPLAMPITDDPAVALRGAEVAIDFTLPAASIRHASLCIGQGCGMVIGTTGHDAAQRAQLEAAAGALIEVQDLGHMCFSALLVWSAMRRAPAPTFRNRGSMRW